jgi:hypothetical protein
MSDPLDAPLPTRPPSPEGAELVAAFSKERSQQAARFDDLAKELLKVELAVPGMYLSALKLASEASRVQSSYATALTALAFVLWACALVASTWSLFPRKYRVLRDVPFRIEAPSPDKSLTEPLSIEELYATVVSFKGRCLGWSAAFCFGGIVAAAVTLYL